MEHISIIPQTITTIWSIPITNTLLTSWLVVALLCLFAVIFSFRLKEIPGRIQSGVEIVIDGFLNFLETIGGSREIALRYFPFVATIFFFVLSANWFGILPGVGSIGFHGEHEEFIAFFRSVNSDLNMTLALALLTVTVSHIVGLVYAGAKGHISKFLNFKNPITLFAGILEAIGEISKIISLSFRLFGNVFAGEVLLVIISFLVPYIAPIPFLGMELFVGLIQALIFSVLAMVAFSSFSFAHEDHEEHHTEKHSANKDRVGTTTVGHHESLRVETAEKV
jgi:F-type H+-transporting ATPase subunit a